MEEWPSLEWFPQTRQFTDKLEVCFTELLGPHKKQLSSKGDKRQFIMEPDMSDQIQVTLSFMVQQWKFL